MSTREEERRRLRRDLHDELGPSMAGVALGLKAAMNAIDADSTGTGAETRQLLERLVAELERSVAVVRRMSYDLRPPTLDERGLVAAVEEYAQRHAPDPPQITVDSRAVPADIPASVEVAAYRIVVEALTNAARHAQAAHCAVTVHADEQALRVQIDDDGSGLPHAFRAGVGITSMRERADEIGGRLEIERRDEGGTRVTARLPLGHGEASGD